MARAAALDPQNADAFRYLGIACSSAGWTDAAETALRQSFRLNDKNAQTAFNLAVLLATLDTPRTADAKEWYEKAKALGAEPSPDLEQYFSER